MKNLFSKLTATFTSALLAAGMFTMIPATANAEEEETVTIHFDLSGDGVKVEDNVYGNPQYIVDFSGVPGTSRYLSDVGLERPGYTFSGWTFDGVQAYIPGDVIQFPETDATLTPVWSDDSDDSEYTVHYEATCDLGPFDKNGRLPDKTKKPGEIVEVALDVFYHPTDSYTQIGWVYEGKAYLGQQKIIMPDHDIEFTPSWHKYRQLKYSVGDVDRVIGVVEQELDRVAGYNLELAEAGRFSRIGFYNSGWHCSADDKIYDPEAFYFMPDEDVVFTAVWKPITYNVIFRREPYGEENFIRIDADTDTSIICPEVGVTKPGYKFGGWEFTEKITGENQKTIYQPGDEFFIYGQISGLGIPLEAIWLEEDLADPVYGDANCDNNVTLADAVKIMQALGNPDAYGVNGSEDGAITRQGWLNADCYFPGEGVTNFDALAVQNLCLNIIPKLPVL